MRNRLGKVVVIATAVLATSMPAFATARVAGAHDAHQVTRIVRCPQAFESFFRTYVAHMRHHQWAWLKAHTDPVLMYGVRQDASGDTGPLQFDDCAPRRGYPRNTRWAELTDYTEYEAIQKRTGAFRMINSEAIES